ncbi:MAG: hypothetical protein MJY87_10290 [Fibrobacter sp.]|nr:hypothetical protein [Fibrobacter sp.]
MKKFVFVLLLVLCNFVFAKTFVAVMETISVDNDIEYSERLFLTDKLRDRAKKVLPAYMDFVIMTRENIQQMLPEGKEIEACLGKCLVETGKNINAHYIAQARVGKFGSQLTLTVEMYETLGNNLVGSFTARNPSAEGLLDEIERQADGLFALIASKNSGNQSFGGGDGFEDINMGGSGYKASGSKSYIVSVNSNPTGAVFSVDGRPDADCSKTPCDITLSAGSHRFSFGLKMYFDKDTIFEVAQSGLKLAVKLNPNFGELTLKPQLQSGVGSTGDLGFEIDGNKVTGEKFRLAPGRHSVAISHGCYETASFNVNINNGSDLVFDKPLVAKTGGLKLDVVENGKPKALPVFVNGNRMGVTPFLETVPVCSKVTIGDDREQVPVKLKVNETVAYKHSISSAIPSSSSKVIPGSDRESSGAKGSAYFTDSRDGQRYKTVKIGNQVWMAENLNYKTNGSCCYENDEGMCKKYGRLYSWYAAKSACPSGWHLPNDNEWNALWTAVGGSSTAGIKLKSKSMNGSDSFGFAVLPAGARRYGYFYDEGVYAYFWSSSEDDSKYAYLWDFNYDGDDVNRYGYNKYNGFSVRCLRNSN